VTSPTPTPIGFDDALTIALFALSESNSPESADAFRVIQLLRKILFALYGTLRETDASNEGDDLAAMLERERLVRLLDLRNGSRIDLPGTEEAAP